MTAASRCRIAALVCIGMLGCASRSSAPERTIELPDPEEQLEAERGSSVVEAPSEEPQEAEEPTDSALVAADTRDEATLMSDDSDFVYSRDPIADQARRVALFPIHIEDEWWRFRAQHLGISVAKAKKRDARISRTRAPADFWDEQTSVEAVSLWTVLCNECHGGRRSLQDALEMPEPAPAWGEGEGLFFGNRRTYKHVFNVVYNGGPERDGVESEMPVWKNILAREMIWALLYFLEYQSGGIEGRFPPSLYPRRPKALGEQ